jgi:RES domain-containing protein
MIIYRLCNELYKDDLSGTGAKLTGGRWNTIGIPVLYTTQNISLAVLEILVNTNTNLIPLSYYLFKIDIPDALHPLIISKEKLKKDWKDDIDYTKWMGTEFCKAGKGLFLQVPSAVVDEECNFIFNTQHKDFKKLKVAYSKKFHFDKRLYLKNE